MKAQAKRWLAKEWLTLLGCTCFVFFEQLVPKLVKEYKDAMSEKESDQRLFQDLNSNDKTEREMAEIFIEARKFTPRKIPLDILTEAAFNSLVVATYFSPFVYLGLWIPRISISALRTLRHNPDSKRSE